MVVSGVPYVDGVFCIRTLIDSCFVCISLCAIILVFMELSIYWYVICISFFILSAHFLSILELIDQNFPFSLIRLFYIPDSLEVHTDVSPFLSVYIKEYIHIVTRTRTYTCIHACVCVCTRAHT